MFKPGCSFLLFFSYPANFLRYCQINNVPKNVRDRLPAEYHRALQVRDHIRPGHLQTTVQQLVIFFHANFDLGFPPLNYAPILVRHIKDLLLPGELYTNIMPLLLCLNSPKNY